MRKIVSKQDEGKKQRRNQIIVGGLLVFVMLFSVLGYSFQGERTKKVKYNGYEFLAQGSFWVLKDRGFAFAYNPYEVNETGEHISGLPYYQGVPLYISSEDTGAEAEIARNLEAVAQRIQLACLEGEKCQKDFLPVKTCEDNFILIKISNISKIEQNQSCVFIEGQKEELIKLADEFLFKILGIR